MAKDRQDKAPSTGNNTQAQNDNKRTADGKPVKADRPHVDKNK